MRVFRRIQLLLSICTSLGLLFRLTLSPVLMYMGRAQLYTGLCTGRQICLCTNLPRHPLETCTCSHCILTSYALAVRNCRCRAYGMKRNSLWTQLGRPDDTQRDTCACAHSAQGSMPNPKKRIETPSWLNSDSKY